MKRHKLTRREFLAITSAAAAGAYGALHPAVAYAARMGGGSMGGGGMGGTAVIDPPPGAAFYDISDATKDASGVYQLQVREARLSVNGVTAMLLTYNGLYPHARPACLPLRGG